MLSNAYFLAKFRFDTAENEPAKNLQNFRKMHFRKMHFRKMHFRKMRFRKMHFRKMHSPPRGAPLPLELAVAVRGRALLVQAQANYVLPGRRKGRGPGKICKAVQSMRSESVFGFFLGGCKKEYPEAGVSKFSSL